MLVSLTDRNDNTKNVSVDATINALNVIDDFHHEIHEGEVFDFSHFFPAVADGATVAVAFRAHSGVTPHIRSNISVGADSVYKFFETAAGALSGSGTTDTPVARNRTNIKESSVSGFVTPTVTTYSGTTLLTEFIPGGTGPFSGGGTGGEAVNEWCIASGTTYIVAIRNISGGASDINIRAQWYEVGRSD